jgi:hypothetical protein
MRVREYSPVSRLKKLQNPQKITGLHRVIYEYHVRNCMISIV